MTTKDPYKHCKDPELDKLLKDTVFLLRKLKFTGEKIGEEHKKWKKELENHAMKASKGLRKNAEAYKTNSNEIELKTVFESAKAHNPLFFYLDTFFIDLKRAVEFSLKFLAKTENISMEKFSLGKTIYQLEEGYTNQKSSFVLMTEKKYPKYFEYLKANKSWLLDIRKKSTNASHKSIYYEVRGFEITFKWNSVESIKDRPQITSGGLKISGEEIISLINKDLAKIAEFYDQTVNLRKDLIINYDNY
ncbi:MAG: hypothetical protein IIA87_01385 [Nanoarchaeota archaeon]|nr:hypothetical protein [Nanoarchaeota archaeon]